MHLLLHTIRSCLCHWFQYWNFQDRHFSTLSCKNNRIHGSNTLQYQTQSLKNGKYFNSWYCCFWDRSLIFGTCVHTIRFRLMVYSSLLIGIQVKSLSAFSICNKKSMTYIIHLLFVWRISSSGDCFYRGLHYCGERISSNPYLHQVKWFLVDYRIRV